MTGKVLLCGSCGFDGLSVDESGGRLDRVPVLLRKGIGALLQAFLALGKALVLSDSHDCDDGVELSSRECGLWVEFSVVCGLRYPEVFRLFEIWCGVLAESRARTDMNEANFIGQF
jgi:hypothetical protein